MNQQLTPDAIERLIKLLGMLGSAHDGERAAAGLKAHEFMRQRGLQWRDVIATVPLARRTPTKWHEMARACWQHSPALNQREREFVRSMMFWHGTPSEKQTAWLTRIYENLP